jgi:hypothetical protein
MECLVLGVPKEPFTHIRFGESGKARTAGDFGWRGETPQVECATQEAQLAIDRAVVNALLAAFGEVPITALVASRNAG